jgi:hypothetical protein
MVHLLTEKGVRQLSPLPKTRYCTDSYSLQVQNDDIVDNGTQVLVLEYSSKSYLLLVNQQSLLLTRRRTRDIHHAMMSDMESNVLLTLVVDYSSN